MAKNSYLKLNSTKLGLTAGIMGAFIVFFTTINGIYGYSEAYNILASSVWSNFGYTLSWTGAFIGAVIGFVYAFIITWISAIIYNKFIS